MNRRNITIAVIAVLALGIGLVIYGILATPRQSTAPPRTVVIAAMNIPANTKIVPAMVTTEQKPSDQVDATALSDPADAVGMLAAADIPQGVMLTPIRLARPAPVPQGLQVAVGMRAITIAVDNVKSVAGLLIPGDHVDVLAAPIRVGAAAPHAYAIVRDARVVAVGRSVGTPQAAPTGSPGPAAPKPTPAPPTTVTLAVTPAQADTIMAADLGGVVRLALRSSHEPARSMTAETMVFAEERKQGPAGPPKPQGVVVVNGSQVTRVIP
ncbi:MAG TPA: Flp pilus assembly protein CpaB, partial [Candidatus Baltobacteraceae bacterium]|nr:Flp pilus assembly protein CpaB [Candidatus Baltobacteraceae bacterium]